MKKILLVSMMLFNLAYSEEFSFNGQVDLFREKIMVGKTKEALEELTSGNPLFLGSLKTSVTAAINKLIDKERELGPIVEFKKVDISCLYDELVQVTCLAIYERGLLRFEIQFYKKKSDWVFYGVNYDTEQMTAELRQGVRYNSARNIRNLSGESK